MQFQKWNYCDVGTGKCHSDGWEVLEHNIVTVEIAQQDVPNRSAPSKLGTNCKFRCGVLGHAGVPM